MRCSHSRLFFLYLELHMHQKSRQDNNNNSDRLTDFVSQDKTRSLLNSSTQTLNWYNKIFNMHSLRKNGSSCGKVCISYEVSRSLMHCFFMSLFSYVCRSVTGRHTGHRHWYKHGNGHHARRGIGPHCSSSWAWSGARTGAWCTGRDSNNGARLCCHRRRSSTNSNRVSARLQSLRPCQVSMPSLLLIALFLFLYFSEKVSKRCLNFTVIQRKFHYFFNK